MVDREQPRPLALAHTRAARLEHRDTTRELHASTPSATMASLEGVPPPAPPPADDAPPPLAVTRDFRPYYSPLELDYLVHPPVRPCSPRPADDRPQRPPHRALPPARVRLHRARRRQARLVSLAISSATRFGSRTPPLLRVLRAHPRLPRPQPSPHHRHGPEAVPPLPPPLFPHRLCLPGACGPSFWLALARNPH